jgi:hypothetical protein
VARQHIALLDRRVQTETKRRVSSMMRAVLHYAPTCPVNRRGVARCPQESASSALDDFARPPHKPQAALS